MLAARILYAALGLIGVVLALVLINDSPAARWLICVICDFQAALGLLFMSITAATNLAEERGHGSLDILLSTPLTTPSIVIGKWWAAFRSVRYLMVWSALIAGALVVESGRWFHYALLLGLILSYGAVIASLGLGLAIWVSKPGRAVALSVITYVVFSIGWIVLTALFPFSDSWGRYLYIGSPLFGTFWAACGTTDTPISPDPTEDWPATFFWVLAQTGIAVALFAATLATFDRCLGRVCEHGRSADLHQIEYLDESIAAAD